MGLMSLIKLGGKIVTGALNAADTIDSLELVAEKTGKLVNKAKNKMSEFSDEMNRKANEKIKSDREKLVGEAFQYIGKYNEEHIILSADKIISWSYETAVKYNKLSECCDKYYIAAIYDKYGVIDIDENIVVPFEYDDLGDYSEDVLIAKKNNKFGYINLKNEIIIDFIFDDASRFCCNIAPVCSEDKYGYVDKSGDFIIPPKYDHAEPFNKNGLSCVRLGKYPNCAYGVIDTSGDTVVNCHYNSIEIYNDYIKCYNGDYFADDSKCYFDLKGKPIEINESEKRENHSSNKSIPYNDSNLKYGHYIETDDGDYCVIKPTFDEEFYFNDAGYAIVKLNGLYGIIKKEDDVM